MPKFSANWLLVLVPVSFALAEVEGLSPAVVFFVAALAIIPLAKLIVHATEHIAVKTGEGIGGLLNATFGNAPELIICIVALRAGLVEMVAASIIGAVLANILLAQGVSFLLGGIKYQNQEYNQNSVRLYSSMMLISCASLMIPGAFSKAVAASPGDQAVATLNIAIACMLLVTYALYLVFTLRTHADLFKAAHGAEHAEGDAHWSLGRSVGTLLAASAVAALLSEVLVGSAEGAGKELGMSEAFMGLICVAIVGGAAESLSAISMGVKNRMDLSLAISMGSSIQIVLFVAPVLVLVSHVFAPQPFHLIFSAQLLVFLLLSVLVGAVVSGDGRSNWYKGVQYLLLYLMLAVTLYLAPAHS